jgi:hypothetical protein
MSTVGNFMLFVATYIFICFAYATNVIQSEVEYNKFFSQKLLLTDVTTMAMTL